MFKIRDDEPAYAFLHDPETMDKNRYGASIDLAKEHHQPRGDSMEINGDQAVGDNPNRYKQHGFHFTAENCIGCHACEAACSEKNNLAPHLAYRSVGYVESGCHPDLTRLNISMACNHCDDPVCLTGCPTRAYTKFAEYGAVLQDPDICFGCGYCTWVCPYNAPQLDPVQGHVEKCNMCVDRLEVGLKPACVSACLGNALEFGVIENIPERREQAEISIPGFPSPEITRPNIRFQQKLSLGRIFQRPDVMPLKYHRDGDSRNYSAVVDDTKRSHDRQWNIKKLLSSHENAHIVFTLSTQAVMGAFMLLMFGEYFGLRGIAFAKSTAFWPLMIAMLAILTFGFVRLNLHLGKPQFFYRGFYNWRLSPVSREIAGVSLFFAGLSGTAFFSLFDNAFARFMAGAAVTATVIGVFAGLYYMYRLYRIPARPFWDHWQTGTSFVGASLTFGGLLIASITVLYTGLDAGLAVVPDLSLIVAGGLGMEAVGLIFHARDLKRNGAEGSVSHFEKVTTYGYSAALRNVLLAGSLLLATMLAFLPMAEIWIWTLGTALLASTLIATIIGRALFYVLVIPTTMPGAFFWRNKGFEEHARTSGLADMPQTGVVPFGH